MPADSTRYRLDRPVHRLARPRAEEGPLPGGSRVLAGKYRLLHELRCGGMGQVWSAEHITLGLPVAIKFLDPTLVCDADARERFANEVYVTAAAQSPHVVLVIDEGTTNGLPYFVMEQLEGETLADRLARDTRLSARETAIVFRQVARAVQTVHDAGYVHRDLKPDNVFLVDNHGECFVKLLDFGIAARSPSDSTLAPMPAIGAPCPFLGTPGYMSPEQIRSLDPVDHRSDLWSLAVLAFECLTGRRPFQAGDRESVLMAICVRPVPVPSRVAPVPPGFDQWFARGVERVIPLRFASARAAADDLWRVCMGSEPETVNAVTTPHSYRALSLPTTTVRALGGRRTTP